MNPQLIPADDLGFDGDLLLIGREISLASGSLDLLCLASSGDLVLIEFKTGPQNPDFRHALAQVIGYGSDLWQLSLDDSDRGAVQRSLGGSHVPDTLAGCHDLRDAIGRAGWELADEAADAVLEHLAEVLRSGDFTFVIAAQRYTEPCARASTTSTRRCVSAGSSSSRLCSSLAPSSQRTRRRWWRRRVGAPRPPPSAVVASLPMRQPLSSLDGDEYRDAFRDFLAACSALGLVLAWGSRGLSIRIPTPDRNEPLSIAWGLLDGAQWQGLRHLSARVDRTSREQTPSLVDPIERYINAVEAIPGGKRLKHQDVGSHLRRRHRTGGCARPHRRDRRAGG